METEQRPQPAGGDGHEPSEAELVERARSGDRGAVDQLLARHLPRLERYVLLRSGGLRRTDGVSDLVQSTCRELLEHADAFRHGGAEAFRNWLYTTASRKIADRYRYQTAQRRDVRRVEGGEEAMEALGAALGLEPSPSQEAMGAELLERMEAAFAGLSEDEREVILLSRVVGLPRAEVARALERTEGATRNLLHRALAKLAAALDRGAD